MKGTTVGVKCGDCGIDIEVSLKRFKSVEPDHIWRCKSCLNKYFSKKMKEYNSNLSKEERSKRSLQALETKKNNPKPISEERKSEIKERRSAAQKRRWNNLSSEDKNKLLKPLLDGKEKYYSSMNDEKWKDFSNAVKKGRSKMSDAEKQSMLNNMSNSMKKWWLSVDEEYKNKQMNCMHERYKEYWDNLKGKDKESILNRMHNGWNDWFDNLSEDEIKNRNNKLNSDLRNWWKKLDEDTKDKRIIYLNDAKNEWWNNLSDAEKYEHYKPIIESLYYAREKWWNELPDREKDVLNDKLVLEHKRWWDNLPDNERKEFADKSSEWWYSLPNSDQERIINNHKDYWKTMPITSKEAFIKKVLSSARGKNQFHQLFERKFNDLESSYNLIEEYPTTNHGVTHCWDYAVSKDDTIQLLVDLDGVYFHADDRDYDGMHSKLEYDEKRGLSIPNNVKWCIIYEKEFDKSFTYMQSIIDLTYDEFIVKRVKEYRSMPFPYPEYTNMELMKSYRDLCKLNCNDKYHKSLNVNTRIGDRLIQHFHHSMYDNLIKVWNGDESLHNMIENGYLYHSYLNKNKILQGFNIYEPCKRTQFISAGKAKMIIHRYLNEYDEIFCPYHSSSIMLACISMNKQYLGICIDEIQQRECDNILRFLNDNGIKYNVRFNDDNTEHDCLFAEVLNDDQIDVCLSKYYCKCYVFIVNISIKYSTKIVDNIIDKSYIQNDKNIIIIEGD